MKLFAKVKDGGPYSKVTAYFLIEWKRFFSIALLRFDKGSREAFHSHAFNCVSWVLRGALHEITRHEVGRIRAHEHQYYTPSLRPVVTRRDTFHQVFGLAERSWVLTFRGPWVDRWREWLLDEKREVTLTHGRVEVAP